jgi:hypothetical protein
LAQRSPPNGGLRGIIEVNGSDKEYKLDGYNGTKNGIHNGVYDSNRSGKFKLSFGALKAIKQKLFPKRVFNRSFVEGTVQDRFSTQDKVAPFSLVN